MNSHFAVSSATPYQKIKILYRENYIQLLRISSNLIILLKRAPLLTIKYRCPEFGKKISNENRSFTFIKYRTTISTTNESLL